MLIDLASAKNHLRLESDYPDEQVLGLLEAAEGRAAQFLNRAIFGTADALASAIAVVPAKLEAASDADAAARVVAAGANASARDLLLEQADRSLSESRALARETLAGIVITAEIRSAILLLLGHLFENREAAITGTIATVLPMGAEYLLAPYRIGWGV